MKFKQERVERGTSRPIRKGEIINEVYKTDDYSIFKLSKFNRNVILRKDMLEQAKQGIVSPIIVNEEMIVIDGQNRLLHSKEVGAPVEYIIKEGLTEEDITRMNVNQKPWSLENYIEAFANKGLDEYVKLVDLISQKFSNVTNTVNIAIDVPTGFQKAKNLVKNGEFTFHDYDKAVEFLHYSKRFREETKTPKRSRVETALYELFRLKGFDKNRIINKVIQTEIAEDIKLKDPKHTEALKMLIDAYNHKLNPASDKYLSYHITSLGTIVIDQDRQSWTKKTSDGKTDEWISVTFFIQNWVVQQHHSSKYCITKIWFYSK